MGKTKVSLKSKAAIKKIKKINREYRPEFQEVIQIMLDEIRFDAIRFIIPNSTGMLNPKQASMRQRSIAGKLTSRTGKLIFMLNHKAKPFGKGYTGKRSKVKKTAGLKESVILQREGSKLEAYRGKVLFEFSNHGRLMSLGSKQITMVRGKPVREKQMPRESSSTLFFRFLHDRQGLKGQGKRPFLTPAARENKRTMTSLAAKRLQKLMSML